MSKYELVMLLNPRMTQEELDSLKNSIQEALPKWSILDIDDVWLIDTKYPLKKDKDLTKVYFVTYYVELSPEDISSFKEKVAYLKWIVRQFFYKLAHKDEFMKYNEVNSWAEKIIEKYESETQLTKKVNILIDKSNLKYLTWKNIKLLERYITRFDNIKPRKFTWHSVKVQKRLRKMIIRARELWLIRYVK